MRKIREVLRLRVEEQRSWREIAASVASGQTTVRDLVNRAKKAGLSWPLPEDVDDERLEALLFPKENPGERTIPPDYASVHIELRRKDVHVTLALLWEEYRLKTEDSCGYSHFCSGYREWRKQQNLTMRQNHKAGEKTFVDFSGDTIPIFDEESGKELFRAQIFVATLGASGYSFSYATKTQSKHDWLHANTMAAEFFGGVSDIQVPDNLKAGITRADYYDPVINPAYYDWSRHHNTTVIPARKRKPKDKAKAENSVLQVERWILARIRNQKFHSLGDLNDAIDSHLEFINTRRMKHLGKSRRELFELLDKPALRPLPKERFEISAWKTCKAGPDYHIDIEGVLYSIPYIYAGKEVDVRYTSTLVEVLCKGKRVAIHQRSHRKGDRRCQTEHMPAHHRAVVEWTPERILKWVAGIGGNAEQFAENMLTSREHPEFAYRACLGLIRLSEKYGKERVDRAAARALAYRVCTYKEVKRILSLGLDAQPLPELPPTPQPFTAHHANIRGPSYYK